MPTKICKIIAWLKRARCTPAKLAWPYGGLGLLKNSFFIRLSLIDSSALSSFQIQMPLGSLCYRSSLSLINSYFSSQYRFSTPLAKPYWSVSTNIPKLFLLIQKLTEPWVVAKTNKPACKRQKLWVRQNIYWDLTTCFNQPNLRFHKSLKWYVSIGCVNWGVLMKK